MITCTEGGLLTFKGDDIFLVSRVVLSCCSEGRYWQQLSLWLPKPFSFFFYINYFQRRSVHQHQSSSEILLSKYQELDCFPHYVSEQELVMDENSFDSE